MCRVDLAIAMLELENRTENDDSEVECSTKRSFDRMNFQVTFKHLLIQICFIG